jgi:hypothetical protein
MSALSGRHRPDDDRSGRRRGGAVDAKENAELLAVLLRRAAREGSLAAAIAAIERERGRPLVLSPAFRERAEQVSRGTLDLVNALFRLAPN